MSLRNRCMWALMVLAAVVVVASSCSSSASSDLGDAASSDQAEGVNVEGVNVDGAEGSSGDGVAGNGEKEDSGSSTGEGFQAGLPLASEAISDLEQQWEGARNQVIKRIATAGFGVDDEGVVLTGPARMQVELVDCPRDWQDRFNTGPIRLAVVLPRSGALASFDDVAQGLEAYLDYVNDVHGGVDGRRIELLVKDDAYDPDQTAEVVEGLLDRDDIFAVITLGSPTSLEVYGDLNDACVPHPFVMSAHPAWGDPANYPWTTGLQLTYTTEARLWGAWIEANLADELPVTVGSLVVDNDQGEAFERAFAAWVEQHPEVVKEFVSERHVGTVPSVADEMEALSEERLDVYISMTFGEACVAALREADRTGLADKVSAMFNPSVCRDAAAYLNPAGSAADGVYIVDGGWQLATDPQLASDPFIAWTRATLDDAGLDPDVGLHSIGFAQYGWTLVETLRLAAELDGGLSRSNFILAQRSLDLDHPLASPGVTMAMNGQRDAYPMEGSGFLRFDADEGAWVQVGRPIDLNGTTPPCKWTGRRCD